MLIVWCIKLKLEDVSGYFSKNKEMFGFSNYSTKSKYYVDSNTAVGKIKDKMGGIAVKEFVGLRAKLYLILVSKYVNKNVVPIISQWI